MWTWHFLGFHILPALGIKLALLNHKWSTIGYEIFLNVIGMSFWLLCDAYISTAHQENVDPKWFSNGAFVFAVCMMHHNIKCMTLAAVSAQYKTTEAEHSRGCHHWTQGQGTCLLTVGCLIFRPSYLCFPALCSCWRYHVHWSIGQAIRFFSPEICVIWLASTYEGHIFCSLCTFASTAEYFLGCLRRWSYQAHRQSWGFLKSSTTKSIRFVNILRSWGLASSSVCYSSSVRRVSKF